MSKKQFAATSLIAVIPAVALVWALVQTVLAGTAGGSAGMWGLIGSTFVMAFGALITPVAIFLMIPADVAVAAPAVAPPPPPAEKPVEETDDDLDEESFADGGDDGEDFDVEASGEDFDDFDDDEDFQTDESFDDFDGDFSDDFDDDEDFV